MEVDFVAGCVEEVALEGLDGITLSSLWLRLQDRPGFSLAMDDQSKRFIWRVLQEQQCLEMFVLPKPRATITISRREKYIDPESGICVEPESLPDEVYPLKLINKNGVMGSCATFDVRENLTERLRKAEISLDHVIKEWGDRLVIVASQGERTRTLMGMVGKPSITLQELTYCLLERIARSRHEGLLMVGKELDVFSEFNLKPKEFFYQRKILARNGLLKKQLVVIRNVKNLMKRVTLAHLPRFFRIWETRFSFVVSKICQMLRELPNHTCERRIIVEQLGLEKYLFKRLMPAAAPYLRLGKMPYSQLYPESPIQDRFYEQGSERILHVVTMVRKYPPEEEASEEEEEDDEEGEEFVNEQASGKTDKHTDDFHYKIENLCNERLFMHKLYSRLEKAGPEGMTQREVQAVFNMNRLEVRAALRRLLKIGLLAEPVMRGEGRQKTGVYMTRGHAKDNKIHQEFVKEKKKYEELNQSSPEKTHTVPETPPTAQKPQKSTKKKSEAPPPEDVIDRSSQDNSVAKKESSKYADGWCKLDMLNLRRMNQIVEAVREAKLLDNVFALQKMITQKEADDVNVQGRIDRRSLLRLINTLAREGKIKSIKTAISSGLHTKNLHFVCDPSIAPSDPIVQSAIDHARFKYFTVAKETCQSLKKDATGVNSSEAQPPPTNMSSYPETIRQSFQKLKEFRSAVKMKDMVYDPTCSRKYGLVPKMSRLRHVHQLLWYHVYGYQGTVPEDLQAFQETTYLGLPRSELPPEETCKGKRTRKKCLPVISPETTEKKSEQCSETVSDVNYCVASTSEAQGKSSIPEEKDVEVKKTVEEDENKMSTKDTDSGLSASKEPVVYLDEMSWKRYLPPLPKHKGYGEGWCLVSDVLLSLPLSIFCHIINIPYRVPGLLELLAHPHKQFYPIITVPRKVSQQLTYARKYMFTFHSILVQLAHLGLLSIGQQQFKDKAQVFVYIHKNATLVDTRSSKVGYMLTRVPGDDPFPRRQYHLDTWNDVECFWSELMDICLSTRLGRYVDFQSTHSSMITGHMSLVEAIAPCTPDTVRDDGIIPGDGMGAAGLDSSLFCHLYRNWVKKKRTEPVTQDADDAFMIRATKLSAIRSMEEKEARKESKGENSVLEFSAKAAHTRLPRLLPYPKLTLDGEATKENRAEVVRGRFVRGARGNRGGRGVKRTGAHQSDRSHSIPKKIRASVAGGVRKKYHKKRTLLMDARDVTAHKLMEKKRVVWTTAEDSLLLLCKVANLYLGGMRNKTVCLVPWTTIRDILHQSLPVSKDKTSSACRRRVPFMMKNPQTVLNVETFLAEAQHDKSITSEFRYQRYKQSTPGAGEAFLKLFNRLREKFISGKFHERGFLPATVSDLRKKYKVSTVGYFKPKRTFCEARTIPEIHQAVIRDTLQSYMSLSDKKGRAHEVYMLFNHYSDAILSQVFGALREDQVITRLKKSPPQSTKRMKQVSDVHDHHLSQSYFNKLHQPMPASVFNECWAMISDLHCHSNDPGWKIELDIKLTKGGTVATIINLLAVRKIKVELEIPEQILVLDDKAKHTVSAKKVRTNLEFLEQKKTNREEDEDIELFEKSQKITSTAMAGAGLFNKAIVSSSPDDVRVESGDIHAELGPDHLVEIVWAGTETETTATPEKATMMTDIPILRPAETTTTTKTASSPEPSTSSETRVSPSKSPRQAKEDSQPDERLATVESRHGTYKVPHGFASRSTLSMLRNRYIDSQHTVAKLNPQDFFLVKSCNIKASMVERNKDEADENLCSVILSEEVMSRVIKSLLRVQPQKVEEAVEWEKMMNVLNTDDVSAARQFYTAVKDAGHFGITETEIKEKMKQNPVDTDTFQKLSVCLQDHHMVLRVGVATHRYVSHAHASHWLLHGYKNTRGRSKPTVTYEPDTSGDVCESTSSQQQEESEGQRDATLTSENNEASQELSSIDETGEASTLARMAKKRKLMEDDITQGLYKSTYERVLFVPRPWRTPEGWLNRGVFTDLTKALTTFLLLNPGSDQQTVIERFNPALQPVATIELIEVLQEIGAVESTFLRKCKKPTLFSTPLICTELARGDPVPAEDCLIVYEARMECISHVGQLCDYVVQQPKIQVSN